ncbi:hypothetical protein MNV49_003832 [Pseudohyphozyma bogoriensis]|nr:hypothetical protein MNV49_003832 [Pseudohyphozyma bogoriensis]
MVQANKSFKVSADAPVGGVYVPPSLLPQPFPGLRRNLLLAPRRNPPACARAHVLLSTFLRTSRAAARPPPIRGTATGTKARDRNTTEPSRAITPSELALLSHLRSLSAPILASPDYTSLLQELKGALYNKEYEKAFAGEFGERGKEVYVSRWVPGRVLVYRRVLDEWKDVWQGGRVLVVGGGAGSEVLAALSLLGDAGDTDARSDELATTATTKAKDTTEFQVLDFGDWTSVLQNGVDHFSSSYSLPTTSFTHTFTHTDVLALPPSTLSQLSLPTTNLITIFFTISELFLQSRAKTLALLGTITKQVKRGTILHIIESASLAEIPIGAEGRVYPLGKLLDHALEMGGWEKVESEESRWFRMPLGVDEAYPVKLENMRVVMRVYRRK